MAVRQRLREGVSCRLFGGGAGMPSVMGLLEERERAARQRVEALQAELREAEAVWALEEPHAGIGRGDLDKALRQAQSLAPLRK